MSKFSQVYFIANDDSRNFEHFDNIDLQIFLGEGNRQWYEPHYLDDSIKPLGKIESMVPIGPNDENSLLDACIIFAPIYFELCPSLKKIELELKDKTFLDFNLDKIPDSWNQLRREAEPIFEKLNIFKMKLIPLTAEQRYLSENYRDSKKVNDFK